MAEAKEQRIVEIPNALTVKELADLIEASPVDVIKELMSNGIMASINQQIDFDTAAIVASEMGFEAQTVTVEDEVVEESQLAAWRGLYEGEDPDQLVNRPPIVAILGHVDHGKTSLLDVIRHTGVQAGEAGGITQHIGAYQAQHEGRTITFLDTPGHEAFTGMRARGAQGADIAVLVVAADDGVMPQTREAISHARAAGVPIVVAMSKVDKTNANAPKVMQELAEAELVPDEWDGDTMVMPVAAKSVEEASGIDDLLEAILLIADDMEIKANPDGRIGGTVLDATKDTKRGVMTTLLVQNGTLKVGDMVQAGATFGRVKAMFDEVNQAVKVAAPSTPVQMMGLNDLPEPGTLFTVHSNEKEARAEAKTLKDAARSTPAGPVRVTTLEELYARYEAGETKELNLIIKADVQGSLDPIINSLEPLREGDIKVNIIHAETGNISESDVMLAAASEAIVIGFHVVVDGPARRMAETSSVEIRSYDIIYRVIEDVESALKGMLEPVYEDTIIGVAEVRQIFRIPKMGNIAGSFIVEGEARRNAKARIMRNGEVLHESGVSSLKRFEEDVREVRSGFECGISVDGFNKFKVGDRIEFIVTERVPQG